MRKSNRYLEALKENFNVVGLASAAAFRPLGQTLAVAGADGRLRFCDLTARTVLCAEGESPRRLERLVWSRDGKTLASYGPDHHIDLWDPHKAELLRPAPGTAGLRPARRFRSTP